MIGYNRPSPFGILKREELSKPQPILGALTHETPKPQSEMTDISPFFQAAESSDVIKKEKKRITKEKKKQDKEKVRSRRRVKLEKFLSRCTDISNINDIIIIDTKSGIDIFSQSFGGRNLDTSLISGFLQAISNFGSTISEAVKESRTLTIEYKDSIVMQTDFLNFKLIITLKEHPSPNFKFIMEDLAYDIYKHYGEEIVKFAGSLKPFLNMNELIEKHLNTSFLHPIRIVENPKIKLNMSEKEMISKARNLVKENNYNYFYSLYLMPENTSTPKNYQTIFNLIEKGIFQPTEE